MRRRGAWIGAAAMCLVVAAGAWALRDGSARLPPAVAEGLASPHPQTCKQAAWAIAGDQLLAGAALLEDRLPREANPDVREALVYALGRLRTGAAAIEHAARTDESGFVRQTAWLALARTDAARFQAAREAAGGPHDEWDRLGVAQGRLEAGDAGGAAELLSLAEAADEHIRQLAGKALSKQVMPILEVAGRWPLDAGIPEGIWPAALLTQIRERCAALKLQQIVDDSRPHAERAKAIRRNVAKLTNARERIARFLFAP